MGGGGCGESYAFTALLTFGIYVYSAGGASVAAKFERIELLDLSLVDPPREPVRKLIDPEYIRELAESIREIGLQEPVKVRPQDGRYEVVFGHCRYLACRLIQEPKIKAIVKEMSDEEVLTARLVENIQRQDLGPMDVARCFGMMRDKLGMEAKDIAKKTGKSVGTVYKYLSLLELDEEAQRALSLRKVSVEVALALSKIGDESTRRQHFVWAIENGVTPALAERWVSDYEKTQAGKYYGEGGSPPFVGPGMIPEPIFHTCKGCRGPVESREVRFLPLCPNCVKELERR